SGMGLLGLGDLRVHLGGNDAPGQARPGDERAVEGDPEPGPEFLRVADRAPDPIEGCAEEDLFFDAIAAAGHAQPPGCVCGSAAGTGTQPDGCLCRLAPRNGLGPLDRTAQLVPAQLPI